MIAILRKNLPYLISKHIPFVCKSSISSPLSSHFFSTWRKKHSVFCPRIYDLLVHKHQFSLQVASVGASDLTRPKCPEKADSVLSFLKESGCSSAQLEKIVVYWPRILSYRVEEIKFKIKLLQDLGLSPEDVAKLISSNQVILLLSAKNKIIPSLTLLKGMLGSDYEVGRLLKKSGRFLCADLEKILVPNVEFLKSIGVPMSRIRFFLFSNPRFFLIKPEIIRKSVEKAKEIGFKENSKMLIYAVRIIASTSKGMWELKLQSFRDMGFSDDDILTMFKKCPNVFKVSMKKIEKIKELLFATGKFNMSSFVNNPASFGCSIENRFKPRLQVLGILESKKLINKWPDLSTIYTSTDAKFFEKFIGPYSDELGGAYATNSCVGKRDETSSMLGNSDC